MGFNLKDYETVDVRIAKFWKAHPEGRISTDLVAYGESYIVKAEIFRSSTDLEPYATGYAEETTGSSPVNRTSALENCETSAIGRALANGGFATKGSRASREEMEKVERVEKRLQATTNEEVSGLVDAFAAVTTSDELTTLAQKVSGLALNDADANMLRAAYKNAKQRLEAS